MKNQSKLAQNLPALPGPNLASDSSDAPTRQSSQSQPAIRRAFVGVSNRVKPGQTQSNQIQPSPPPDGKETVKFLTRPFPLNPTKSLPCHPPVHQSNPIVLPHRSCPVGLASDLALGILVIASYSVPMALVRILVDGYSLLHNWPELAPGKPRHSAAARDELIRIITLYRDAVRTPITIFFDGAGAPTGTPVAVSTPEVEVLYSKSGQTADQMIERAAHRFAHYGEVMAVTDDLAERDTVVSLGGSTSSCLNFIQTVENALAELADDIKHHNRRERHKFQKR